MKLRTPRTEVPKRSYLQDTIALCHPKMLFVIVCLTTIGHCLSKAPFSIERYLLGIAGVITGVFACYRANEAKDMTTTSIPRSHHIAIGSAFLITALLIGLYLVRTVGLYIAALVAITFALMLSYNLSSWKGIHNKGVYAFVWGFCPLCFSGLLQNLSPIPTIEMLIFGAWAMVTAVATLFLWGPTTCGRMATCDKAKGKPIKHICHSTVLRCRDRVVMPKAVNDHMKLQIALNDIQIFIITMAVVTWRFVT